MASRDLNEAVPELVAAYAHVKKTFEATFPRYELRPTTTYRSPDEQRIEFEAGRSTLDGVSKLSKHNFRPARAIDIGIFRKNPKGVPAAYIDELLSAGKFDEDLHRSLYWNLGLLAQRQGLRWGGSWRDEDIPFLRKPIDPYHVEMRGDV